MINFKKKNETNSSNSFIRKCRVGRKSKNNLITLTALMLLSSGSFAQLWSESIKITASDANAGDNYGSDVAVDGSYAIIGAHNDDDGGTAAGSAYIIEQDIDGTWSEAQKLNASDAWGYDYFGEAVAISGNFAVVGAHGDDHGPWNAGSAYIFERGGDGTWTEVQKLTASDTIANDRFGREVAILDDFIFVGSPMDDEVAINSGSVYIFERGDDGIWTQVQMITASVPGPNYNFGRSISVDGDNLIIGAVDDIDEFTEDAGAAYIFELDDMGDWVEVQRLTASDEAESDNFGHSVSISGSYAVIGAYRNDDGASQAGSAYVFEQGDDGIWVEVQKLTASVPEAIELFGEMVAIDGNSIAVGATTDGAGTDEGSVYIYELDGDGSWEEVQQVTASDVSSYDIFSRGIGISDNQILVGSYYDDDGGTNSGSAYVFTRCSDISVDASATETCLGSEVVLTGTSETGGTVTWSDGVVNGEAFLPPLGTTTYFATGGENDCDYQIDITVNELPLIEIITADSVVCPGEEVTLSGDGAVTYAWDGGIMDGVAFEPPLGETVYTVTGTDDNDCENMASITVIVNEAPEVVATADDSVVCAGEMVTLVGEGAITYSWDGGVTDGAAFEPPVGETVYTVTGTDDNDCESSATISITVNALPEVEATADDTEVCDGEEITLVGEGAITYAWDGGVTDGAAFTPPVGETTYTVTGTDDNDCSATDSIIITVFENPEVEIEALEDDVLCITAAPVELVASPASGTFSGTGVSGTTFEPNTAGEGTHTIYYYYENDEGCSATDSVEVSVVDCLSIPEYDNLSMKIYPNPFTDFATIAFDRELNGDHTIVIYDILGNEVCRYNNLSGNQLIISREELPSGVYFLSVLSQSETVGTVRLVVQ